MQSFIYDGSEYQINLSDAVRSRTEEKFKDWVATLIASVTRDAQGQFYSILYCVVVSLTITHK